MRVIAGKYRSRPLRSLKGQMLRPTSDRLRETLFNILGATVEGATFVDLYAGTGAVGIEALSRGARHAIFVEQHAPAVALIRRNLESLGIGAEAEILGVNVARAVERLEARHLHAQFIFLDPPYAADAEYESALDALGESPLVPPEGRVIVEHLKKRDLPERAGELELARVVEQGDAALSFYRLALAA
jgi:16S rRNA (guanine(966)-N(2))-methyltransferase RsmD